MAAPATPLPKFRPFATYFLIAVNVIFFLGELVASKNFLLPSDSVLNSLAFYAPTVFTGNFQLVLTSMTTHASWEHLLGNMAFLLVFGPKVEMYLRRMRFITLFVLGGAIADFSFAAWGGVYQGAVGASGAIAFILGMFWQLFPNSVITFQGKQIKAFYYLGTWFLFQAAEVFVGASSGVAVAAHAAGFAVGALIALDLEPYLDTSFGLLEHPEDLSAQEELNAAQAVISGDVPTSTT